MKSSTTVTNTPLSDRECERRSDMLARLYTALDSKMSEIENRISASGSDASASDSERDARTLTSLARLLEKLGEMKSASARVAKGGRSSEEPDADRIRDEIAQRLERMLTTGQGRESSE